MTKEKIKKAIEKMYTIYESQSEALIYKLLEKVHPLLEAHLVFNFELGKFVIWTLSPNESVYPLDSYVLLYELGTAYYSYLQDLFSECRENPENKELSDEELWEEILFSEFEKIYFDIRESWDNGDYAKEIFQILKEHPEYTEKILEGKEV